MNGIFLTDMHTHSTYSHDGKDELSAMLDEAVRRGLVFYGVSEHFDYDYDLSCLTAEEKAKIQNADPSEYFHGARHLQEDYGGVLNVVVGAEFGYSERKEVQDRYALTWEKYRPDYVINSVHGDDGQDYARYEFHKTRKETFLDYLRLVRKSLDAPYPYDVVGHLGYVARYMPFENRRMGLDEFGAEIDDILRTVIERDKILEINTASKTLENCTLPSLELAVRYFELGGRAVSFGSDAHTRARIADKREETVVALKKIGFTYLSVPFRGERIKVEI